jgi:hypothetical protein
MGDGARDVVNPANLIGGGLPTRRYVREKNAGRVDLAAFVTGLVRVCDGFVTFFALQVVDGQQCDGCYG